MQHSEISRCYGEFVCPQCSHKWGSAKVHCFRGTTEVAYLQACGECNTPCLPKLISRLLRRRKKRGEDGPDRSHKAELCEKCQDGYPCDEDHVEEEKFEMLEDDEPGDFGSPVMPPDHHGIMDEEMIPVDDDISFYEKQGGNTGEEEEDYRMADDEFGERYDELLVTIPNDNCYDTMELMGELSAMDGRRVQFFPGTGLP